VILSGYDICNTGTLTRGSRKRSVVVLPVIAPKSVADEQISAVTWHVSGPCQTHVIV
jgi:hypothetical protein